MTPTPQAAVRARLDLQDELAEAIASYLAYADANLDGWVLYIHPVYGAQIKQVTTDGVPTGRRYDLDLRVHLIELDAAPAAEPTDQEVPR